MSNYEVIQTANGGLIKAWKKGVPFEELTIEQLKKVASLPFVHHHVAAMPDAHWGMGTTVGTVLPTVGAIVPAAVGVDIGCGMMAVHTGLPREAFTDLPGIRTAIELAVPHGRTHNGGAGDCGAWAATPEAIQAVWDAEFAADYEDLCSRHPGARARNTFNHLGTLGTGNHFLELAADEQGGVWIVLHSGSRGMGNKIGDYFTRTAQELCERWFVPLPDRNLAYLPQGTPEFASYLKAVKLAQRFAWRNRELMLQQIVEALRSTGHEVRPGETVHCHHNYIAWERHFGEDVMVTRKGAVRAQEGDLGIIPGSMGARTYIVRGLGNRDSFCTCSHGAGRAMGRKEAMRRFTLADHVAATQGVECLKDESVLDETPLAYKDIEAVMAAQSDLVEPVYRLKQFVCVKGGMEK